MFTNTISVKEFLKSSFTARIIQRWEVYFYILITLLFLFTFFRKYGSLLHENRKFILSTRPPFVTLLSRRAQSGRRSSFGKRVWLTESHIVLIIYFLLVLFTQFILDIK